MAIDLMTRYEVVTCARCGMSFAMPEGFATSLRRSHNSFYCPKGHSLEFPGESDVDRARREASEARDKLAREIARHDQTREALRHEERKRIATRGHLTRMKKRVGSGICPCCNRSFLALARHMESKHPEYKDSES